MKLLARIHQNRIKKSNFKHETGTCFLGRSEQTTQEETTSNNKYTSLLSLRKLKTDCFR